jgi:hypothetical protein
MTRVWEHSQCKGSELLLLLAIADHANDDGYAFPSVATLAQKTRLSRRQVLRVIQHVEAMGELEVIRAPNKCNRYVVKRPATTLGDKMSPGSYPQGSDKMSPPGSDILSLPGDIAMSPEPSYNHQYIDGGGKDNIIEPGYHYRALVTLGVTATVAGKLVCQCEPALIDAWLDYVRVHGGRLRSQAGFIVSKLQAGARPPKRKPARDDPDRYISGEYAEFVER